MVVEREVRLRESRNLALRDMYGRRKGFKMQGGKSRSTRYYQSMVRRGLRGTQCAGSAARSAHRQPMVPRGLWVKKGGGGKRGL